MYDSKLVNRLGTYEMATTIEDKIKTASEKLAKLKAAKRKRESRINAPIKAAAKKLEDRKKLLLGVAVLEGLKTKKVNQAFIDMIVENGLTSDSDRAVFPSKRPEFVFSVLLLVITSAVDNLPSPQQAVDCPYG
jgi:hypothetical protein